MIRTSILSCVIFFGTIGSPLYAQDISPAIDAEFLGMGALYQINAQEAYDLGVTGDGVTVAVIDTGINYFHPELFPQIADGGFDFYNNVFDYMDYNGHGSLVSGIIAAARDGYGMHGIAYNSKILPLKVTNDDGEFFSYEGINWALYQAIQEDAPIINYSGTYAIGDGFMLTDGGVLASTGFFYTALSDKIIVASVGNHESGNPIFPALIPYVKPENHDSGVYTFSDDLTADVSSLDWSLAESNIIAVAAADQNGVISDFSNHCGVAAAWCITAPGEGITTTFWYDYYVTFDGTSLSAPMVSGALALLKELFPHLSGAQLVDLVLRTANKSGIYADESIYGQGFLDIGAAISPQGYLQMVTSDGSASGVSLLNSSVTSGGAFGNSFQSGLDSQSTLISDDYARNYAVALNGMTHSAAENRLTPDEKMMFMNMGQQAQFYQVSNKLSYVSFAPTSSLGTQDAMRNSMWGYRSGRNYLSFRKGTATQFDDQPAQSVELLKNRVFAPAYLDMTVDGNAFGWRYDVSENANFTVSYRDGESLYDDDIKAKGANIDLRLNGYNGTALDLTYGFVTEDESVLGAKGTGAFEFAPNAQTQYIGVSAILPIWENTSLLGSFYAGQTDAKGSSDSLIDDISVIRHQQAAFGVEQHSLWKESDRLSFVWEMPLRVTGGDLSLDLYNSSAVGQGVNIDLSPRSAEQNLHLFYDAPLPSMDGIIGAQVTYSNNTGHVDDAHDAAFLLHFKRAF